MVLDALDDCSFEDLKQTAPFFFTNCLGSCIILVHVQAILGPYYRRAFKETFVVILYNPETHEFRHLGFPDV